MVFYFREPDEYTPEDYYGHLMGHLEDMPPERRGPRNYGLSSREIRPVKVAIRAIKRNLSRHQNPRSASLVHRLQWVDKLYVVMCDGLDGLPALVNLTPGQPNYLLADVIQFKGKARLERYAIYSRLNRPIPFLEQDNT